MMYRVGAKNEAAGTTGLAHYAEHMNFRATRRFPGHEITESVTRRGGRWTGYTWIDQTFYQTTFAKDDLDLALDLEADRMGEALYDEKEFAQERTSVVAELRSYDDPHALLYDEVLSAAFLIHPYRNNTIGWLTDVESVSRDVGLPLLPALLPPAERGAGHRRGLRPGQAALGAVRARFAAKAAGEDDAHVSTVEPPQSGERRLTVAQAGVLRRGARGLSGPRPAPSPTSRPWSSSTRFSPAARACASSPPTRPPPTLPCDRRSWRRGRRLSAASAFQASRLPLRLHPEGHHRARPRAWPRPRRRSSRRSRRPRPASGRRPTWHARGARCGRAWPATSTPWPGASTSSRSSRCRAASSTCADLESAARGGHGRRRAPLRPRMARSREGDHRLVRAHAGGARVHGRRSPARAPRSRLLRPRHPQRLPPRRSRPALSPRATGRAARSGEAAYRTPLERPAARALRPSRARASWPCAGRIEAGAIHETKAGASVLAARLFALAARGGWGTAPRALARRRPGRGGATPAFSSSGRAACPRTCPRWRGRWPAASPPIRRRSARPARRPGTPRPPPWPTPARFSAPGRAPPSSRLPRRSPDRPGATRRRSPAFPRRTSRRSRDVPDSGPDRAERGGTGRGGGGEAGGRGRLRGNGPNDEGRLPSSPTRVAATRGDPAPPGPRGSPRAGVVDGRLRAARGRLPERHPGGGAGRPVARPRPRGHLPAAVPARRDLLQRPAGPGPGRAGARLLRLDDPRRGAWPARLPARPDRGVEGGHARGPAADPRRARRSRPRALHGRRAPGGQGLPAGQGGPGARWRDPARPGPLWKASRAAPRPRT